MLADVGRGVAVDGRAVLEEGWFGRSLGAAGQHEVGAEVRADHLGEGAEVVADQRHLPAGGELEVEGAKQVGEGAGAAGGGFREESQDAGRLAFVGAVSGQGGEAQQPQRGRGVAGGDRVVVDLLAAGDQRLVVVGGGEETAPLGIPEAGDRRTGEIAGLLEPAPLEGRLVQRQQRLEQEGVVLQVCVELRLAVLVGAQEAAFGVAQGAQHELGAAARRVKVVLASQHRAGLGQGGDHQRVPGGEALVVEARPDPLRARLAEGPAGLGEALGLGRRRAARQVEDASPLEVARLGDPVVVDRLLRRLAQHGADLLRRPDVEAALLALGVGVERRVEAALRPAHLAQRPVERLLADAAVALVPERLPAVQVGAGEQRVVVEHLLEVGDEPGGVDRVAPEAAAELVVDAARQHCVERRLDHVPDPAGEQQLQRRGGRELRRAAEAAALRVGALAQRLDGRLEEAGAGRLLGRLQLPDRAELRPRLRRPRPQLVAPPLEGVDHRLHHHPEARHPAAVVGREVGAAVEGHPLGVAEDGHRPAAPPGHRLHRLHVEGVDVGALLAVDLDADEVLVHVGGGLRVLEGLALHHVAPVAGRVADREQDRAVLLASPGQRLGAPRVPVHRVLPVLEQVGTDLLRQAVGHEPSLLVDAWS